MSEYGATCAVTPGLNRGVKILSEKIKLGKDFIQALEGQNFSSLARLFANEVRFRALVPPGVCEAANPSDAIAWLKRWFGDADQLQVLDSVVDQVFDRLYIKYRLRTHDDAHGWRVIEQQVYCNVKDGAIDDIWLLCSGFRPEQAAPADTACD